MSQNRRPDGQEIGDRIRKYLPEFSNSSKTASARAALSQGVESM